MKVNTYNILKSVMDTPNEFSNAEECVPKCAYSMQHLTFVNQALGDGKADTFICTSNKKSLHCNIGPELANY